MGMVLHMDAEFYPRFLTTIAGRRWILSCGLRLVLAKCLASPEYLSAMGEAIGRAIDKGMQDGLTTGIEHGRARRSITDVVAVRGDATARRLSLTDYILLLVEPLSTRNLTGKASSSATLATAVTISFLTTFAQTNPVPSVLSIE
nr:transposase (putative), gypsy type [Tanacetum cinerariifolium]